MFRVRCAAEDAAEVLLSPRRIRAIHLTGETSEIHYTCWCGAEGVVVDRRLRAPAPIDPVPLPADPVAA